MAGILLATATLGQENPTIHFGPQIKTFTTRHNPTYSKSKIHQY